MGKGSLNVLVLEDESAHAELMRRAFESHGQRFKLEVLDNLAKARRYLARVEPDMVITDLVLPDGRGTELLEIGPHHPPFPVMVMTAQGDERAAVEAMKAGAVDYVVKSPESFSNMPHLVERILRERGHIFQGRWAEGDVRLFQTLIDQSDDAMFITETDTGRLLYVNEKACSGLEYDWDELLRMTMMEIDTTIPDESSLKEVILDRLDGQGGLVLESEHRRRDGTTFPVELSIKNVVHGGNQYTITVARDITERKTAEESLRQSELKFRLVTETIKDVFWMSSLGIGEMVYISPSYEIIWERSTDSLYQNPRSFQEAIHPDDLDGYLEVVERCHNHGLAYECDYRIIRRDGSVRWIQERGYPVSHSSDRTQLMAGVCTDITARKQAEEALVLERAQLLSIFDSIDEIIYITDPETYEILYVNQTIKDAFQKELVGGICYRELQGFDSPCEFCTNEIILKQKPKPHRWEYHNPMLQRDYSIIDRVIKWPDGRDVRFELAIDITARKQVEDALKKSESMTRALLSGIPDLVLRLRRDGTYLDYHAPSEDEFAVEPEDFLGRTVSEVLPPEAAEQRMAVIARAFDTGEIQSFRFQLLRRGEPVHYDARIMVSGEDEVVMVARDITQQKHNEDALSNSEEKYRNLFNNAQVGMFRTRLDGSEVLDINEKCLEIYGLTREEAQGSPSILRWADPLDRQELVRRLEAEDKVVNFEGPMLNKWGELRYVLMSLVVDRDQGILEGSAADVTERRLAEEALRQSELRFRELFDHMSDGVAIYRAEADGRDFVFVDYNRAGERITRIKKEDIVERSVLDVFPGVKEVGLFEVLQRVWETGRPEPVEATLYQDDRVSVWLENYVFKLPSGEIVVMYGDVTERKKAEEEVMRSRDRLRGLYARLQTAQEEERARIAREIHDELGQAMTAAKIDLAVLKREFSDESGEPKQRLESALGLLDETMLMVRRISRDLRPSILDDFGLAAAIEWYAVEFGQRTGVKCRLDLQSDIALEDTDIITAVYRIFQEALTNVARHAEATEVSVSLAVEGDVVTLTVKDNGRGFTEREMAKKESFGLIGMQERVEYLGGRFLVEGSPGEGTAVTASLPFRAIRGGS